VQAVSDTHDPEIDDPDDELEPEAELVAQRLAEGASHAEAALLIGRGAKWVQRRLRNDRAFRDRVRELRQARITQAGSRLGSLLDQVWAMAERNLNAPRPADQIAAGRLIADRERVYTPASDTADEIKDLKQQVAELTSLVAEARATQNGDNR
jgi:HAMP domain-containing protein